MHLIFTGISFLTSNIYFPSEWKKMYIYDNIQQLQPVAALFPMLKLAFTLYNSMYLSDSNFLAYTVSLLGICMCVCLHIYVCICFCAFSTYWTDDIPEDAFLWESEFNFSSFPDLESGKALGFRISGKTKKSNLI